jgi:hypothetical protein
LEGYRRGGRTLVSRASVQSIVDAPPVTVQQVFERELDAALEPFEPLEGEHLSQKDISASATWEGRRPWERSRAASR